MSLFMAKSYVYNCGTYIFVLMSVSSVLQDLAWMLCYYMRFFYMYGRLLGGWGAFTLYMFERYVVLAFFATSLTRRIKNAWVLLYILYIFCTYLYRKCPTREDTSSWNNIMSIFCVIIIIKKYLLQT